MSAASALRDKLAADGAVSAIVGTRIFPIDPRGATTGDAYIIFQQIAADPGVTHGGAAGATERMFQVACFARTYEAAISLRDAAIAALDGVELSNGDNPTLEDERDGEFDHAAECYRADADFLV